MTAYNHVKPLTAVIEIAFLAPGRETEVRDAIVDGIDHIFEHDLTGLVDGAESRIDFHQRIQWTDE